MTDNGRKPAWFLYLLTVLVIATTTLCWPRYEREYTEAPIAWDVSGYYLYLPAVFIYDDLRELKFLPDIIEKYKPSIAPDQAFAYGETAEGQPRYVMKYSAGMALLYLPFFLLAHAVASLGPWPADGFSLPYQVAIQWGGVLVALAGLWLLLRLLLQWFSSWVAGLTVLVIGLGTNFFNYATYDSGNTHVWLFGLLAAVVWLTHRWFRQPTWRHSALLGLSIGLAALARPTELLYILVPLTWVACRHAERLVLLHSHFPKVLLAAAITGAVGFIQLAYWKYAAGEWVVYSYQDQGFSFLRPHFSDVFFSWRKGWLVYTPLMTLALAGFPLLWRSRRELFWTAFVFFVVNTWVVASWDIWWYGGAFGQRAMIQSYVLLAFPIAAFFQWAFRRNWVAIPVAAVVGAGIFFNQFQTWQAHNGPFEADAMNKAYYWRIFLKTEKNPYDRLLLDNTEVPPPGLVPTDTLLFEDFENFADTTSLKIGVAHSGNRSLFLPATEGGRAAVNLPKGENLSPGDWLQFSAWFYGPVKEWEPWWMPQFVVWLEKDGQPVDQRMIRPFRVVGDNEWRQAALYFKLPNLDFDGFRIFLLNPRSKVTLHMDDLMVVKLVAGGSPSSRGRL
jgi:hypothetical protein